MEKIKGALVGCVAFIVFGFFYGFALGADTDSLVVTEAGNVGIGTTNPTEKLTISNGNLELKGSEGLTALKLIDGGTGDPGYAQFLHYGKVVIQVGAGSGGTFFNLGNVGIGTTEPIAKLDVDGSIKANNHLTHLPWYNLGRAPQGAWVPGYIKLITPIVQNESNMFSIKIKGYRYGLGGLPVEIQCGGYAYSTSGLIQTGCNTEGTSDPVGIGVEDNHVVITIGSGTNIWYYDHFTAEYSGWNPKRPQDFKWEFVYNQPPNTSNTNNVIVNDAAGTIMASSYNSPSDARWKKDIEPIDNALERVSQLRGVQYHWVDDARGGGMQVGVIAQEMEEVFPEVVSTDNQGYKSVAYGKLVVPLVEAVKELKAENDDLKAQLEALSDRLAALEVK